MTRSFQLEVAFYLYGTFDAADVAEVLTGANLGPEYRVDSHLTPEAAAAQRWPLNEPPFCQMLVEDNAPLVEQALAAPHVITLVASAENPANPLAVYLDLVQVLSLLVISDGAVAVVDVRSGIISSAEYWTTRVAIPLASNDIEMSDHVGMKVIQQADGRFWLSTRGLIKFAKPELSVHDLAHEGVPEAAAMLGAFGGSMVLRNDVPGDGDTIVQKPGEVEYVVNLGGSYEDADFWRSVHLEFTRKAL